MEFIYHISLTVTINNTEAGLLYKYLKMHPQEKKYIMEGQFAYAFREHDMREEFDLTINMEVLDSCVRVLEDQYLNDSEENIFKEKFLGKLYMWSGMMTDEDNAIENLRVDFHRVCYVEGLAESYEFSFQNYHKLMSPNTIHFEDAKPKKSLLKIIKDFFMS